MLFTWTCLSNLRNAELGEFSVVASSSTVVSLYSGNVHDSCRSKLCVTYFVSISNTAQPTEAKSIVCWFQVPDRSGMTVLLQSSSTCRDKLLHLGGFVRIISALWARRFCSR